MDEKSFHSGDLTLRYAEGPDFGDPLVFLHGASDDWHMWEPFLPRLLPNWHIYTVDLRGHGGSDRAGQDNYTLNHFADDIVRFLTAIVHRPAVLVGHSLGSLVALFAAASAPRQVRALVLHDPPLYIWRSADHDPGILTYFSFLKGTLAAQPTYDQVEASCASALRSWGLDPTPEMVSGMAAPISKLDACIIDVLLTNQLIADTDLDAVLGAVSCPVTFLQADRAAGGVMRDEDVPQVLGRIPHAQIIRLPGASHDIIAAYDTLMDQVERLRQPA